MHGDPSQQVSIQNQILTQGAHKQSSHSNQQPATSNSWWEQNQPDGYQPEILQRCPAKRLNLNQSVGAEDEETLTDSSQQIAHTTERQQIH